MKSPWVTTSTRSSPKRATPAGLQIGEGDAGRADQVGAFAVAAGFDRPVVAARAPDARVQAQPLGEAAVRQEPQQHGQQHAAEHAAVAEHEHPALLEDAEHGEGEHTDAQDPGDAEARQDERLHGQQDHPDQDQEHVPDAGRRRDHRREREQRQGEQPDRAGDAEAGREELDHEPADAQHEEQAGHDRQRQDAAQTLGQVRLEPLDAGAAVPELLEGVADRARLDVGDVVLDGLRRRERQQLAAGRQPGDLDALVDHRLGDARVAPARLGHRAELAAEGARELLVDGPDAGRGDLDRQRGADGRARQHRQLLGRHRDERAGREGVAHHGHGGHLAAVEDVVDDALHGGHGAAGGVDHEEQRQRPLAVRAIDARAYELRGRAGDLRLDRDDPHRVARRLVLRRRSRHASKDHDIAARRSAATPSPVNEGCMTCRTRFTPGV
jgi:hypothetical protein